jgi:hypothetical protein
MQSRIVLIYLQQSEIWMATLVTRRVSHVLDIRLYMNRVREEG